jgi:hypothetical protein
MDKITATELQGMVSHWAGTPPNGYLGSSYGADTLAMLQNPMKTGLADSFLNKLRTDVPLVGALPPAAVNVYAQDQGPDKRTIFIEASGQMVALGSMK